ncbi:MAG: preprotein translocase subunit SecA, partial [Desulfohalobium sp.]
MFAGIAKKMFGSKNERYLKTVWPLVETINGYEPQMQQLHDEDFPAKINEWREEVAHGRSIEELLPEVFALVREASQRALHMRHFDVQLLGGIILHKGR